MNSWNKIGNYFEGFTYLGCNYIFFAIIRKIWNYARTNSY